MKSHTINIDVPVSMRRKDNTKIFDFVLPSTIKHIVGISSYSIIRNNYDTNINMEIFLNNEKQCFAGDVQYQTGTTNAKSSKMIPCNIFVEPNAENRAIIYVAKRGHTNSTNPDYVLPVSITFLSL